MDQRLPRTRSERELFEDNRRFYDLLWSGARLIEPERFNTWPLVQSIMPTGRRLEVAPGLRPRLPIEGTQFVDVSQAALKALQGRGADPVMGSITALPFPEATFALVCALDIVEHIDDEDGALSELARVAASGGLLLLSTPLHPARWNSFDDFVGHKRRYEPRRLLAKLAQHHFRVERSAAYGMQPRSSRLLDLGMWWLTHHREHAMWWYNTVFMTLGLRMQQRLQVSQGMMAADAIDEILLVCRRTDRA